VADKSYQELKSYLASSLDISSTNLAEVSQAFEKLYLGFQSEAAKALSLEPVANTRLTWVRSKQSDDSRVLLFFHGGGFTMGDTRDHLELIAGLMAESNISVLSVDYRLCPEHLFPAPLEDVLAAYRWLLQKGYSSDQVAFSGISAGGLLVTQLILKCFEEGLKQPKVALVLSGLGDLNFNVGSCQYNANRDWITVQRLQNVKKSYLPANLEPYTALLSPLTYPYSTYPTTLFQAGDFELLLDYSIQFYQGLRQSNLDVYLDIVPELPHCWQLFSRDYAPGRRALQNVRFFLERQF
jgi:monoterpene epsilon-lactone hydrolase